MKQYDFADVTQTSFELNTQPQLQVLQHLALADTAVKTLPNSHAQQAEIILLREGEAACTVGQQDYKLRAGEALLIGSGQLHSLFEDEDTHVEAYVLRFSHLRLRTRPDGQLVADGQSPLIHLGAQRLVPLWHLCEALEGIAGLGGQDEPLVAESASHLLQALIACLAACAKARPEDAGAPAYNLGVSIKSYLDEHYLEDLNLKAVAAALNMSPSYLSHTFKKLSGASPMQYIARRRIGEAQNLLLTTNRTVTDIALACGYHDSNYFQLVFNKLVGMPPGKYRKAWK